MGITVYQIISQFLLFHQFRTRRRRGGRRRNNKSRGILPVEWRSKNLFSSSPSNFCFFLRASRKRNNRTKQQQQKKKSEEEEEEEEEELNQEEEKLVSLTLQARLASSLLLSS